MDVTRVTVVGTPVPVGECPRLVDESLHVPTVNYGQPMVVDVNDYSAVNSPWTVVSYDRLYQTCQPHA